MKNNDDAFILIKYRQQLIASDWIESKRIDNLFNTEYTAIKAATMLDGIVKLLHRETIDKYPSLPKEIVTDLAKDVTQISMLIGKDIADYDSLDTEQMYALNKLIFSFYLFKYFFAKKRKLEEAKEVWGSPSVKRPLSNLSNN